MERSHLMNQVWPMQEIKEPDFIHLLLAMPLR